MFECGPMWAFHLEIRVEGFAVWAIWTSRDLGILIYQFHAVLESPSPEP